MSYLFFRELKTYIRDMIISTSIEHVLNEYDNVNLFAYWNELKTNIFVISLFQFLLLRAASQSWADDVRPSQEVLSSDKVRRVGG